jgi:hypothetical protein
VHPRQQQQQQQQIKTNKNALKMCNYEEDEDDFEFTCRECSTSQGLNNCELCDASNVCEECHGQGGDYGLNEIWVCHECLPICLEFKSKLNNASDECCGKGRSDINEGEE